MKGKLFLFLFALPFFGVGVWMGYSIGSNLIDAWQMQQWTPVDAVLHRAGYETHSGDDSDTYKAYAEYSYAYGGQTYLNDRVAISGGGDNIGDYQQDLGRRLGGVMGRGESVTVYVNPADPSDSIIDPTIRWGLLGFKAIFFLVFGGVGLGLMIATFRAPKEKDDSAPKFVDKPWLANDKWQGGPLRSGSKSSMWFAWGFAALWNLISAPLPFVVYEEVVEKDNMLASIGLLFPAIGMGLLWWAVSRTLEWRRFGAAPLTLDPFPGSIGGHVGGMIDVNVPFDSSIRFSLTLTNLHSYVTGSGDSRSRKESPKWQDSQVAHSTSGPGGTRLSFRFDVPDNLAESDADQHEESYDLWRLNLKAELPGADIDRDYEIPVYATAEQSSRLSNFSINEAQSEQRKIDLDVIRNMVDLEHGVSGKSMVYPMFRNLGSGISGLFFGGVFSAIGWFLFDQEGHLFMGGMFGVVGMVIVLSSFYFLFNSLEITQSGDSIQTVRRILGFPVKKREMQRSDFLRFDKKSSMSTQSGTKHVMHYTLHAIQRGGQKLVLGEGFKGASQANAAADFMARELGLSPQEKMQDESDRFGSYNVLTAE
jgi:hypothetical protein